MSNTDNRNYNVTNKDINKFLTGTGEVPVAPYRGQSQIEESIITKAHTFTFENDEGKCVTRRIRFVIHTYDIYDPNTDSTTHWIKARDIGTSTLNFSTDLYPGRIETSLRLVPTHKEAEFFKYDKRMLGRETLWSTNMVVAYLTKRVLRIRGVYGNRGKRPNKFTSFEQRVVKELFGFNIPSDCVIPTPHVYSDGQHSAEEKLMYSKNVWMQKACVASKRATAAAKYAENANDAARLSVVEAF